MDDKLQNIFTVFWPKFVTSNFPNAVEENDKLYGMKVVEDAGDSEVLKPGQIVSPRVLRDENSLLKRNDKN